jgi:hypothetical protein
VNSRFQVNNRFHMEGCPRIGSRTLRSINKHFNTWSSCPLFILCRFQLVQYAEDTQRYVWENLQWAVWTHRRISVLNASPIRVGAIIIQPPNHGWKLTNNDEWEHTWKARKLPLRTRTRTIKDANWGDEWERVLFEKGRIQAGWRLLLSSGKALPTNPCATSLEPWRRDPIAEEGTMPQIADLETELTAQMYLTFTLIVFPLSFSAWFYSISINRYSGSVVDEGAAEGKGKQTTDSYYQCI